MPKTTQSAARVAATRAWFAVHARDLPWRDPQCSAWGVLVSEVMLQQTPVVRVLPVWQAWMTLWPTAADVARARLDEVLRAWGSLGYPRRGRRLWECAQHIVEHHGGEVPSDHAALLALPGVGEYTASAVRSFAYGERAVVLDTNVRRVIARVWSGVFLPPPHLGAAERELAASIVPEDAGQAAEWNAGAMELGALVCTSRAPACDRCPLATHCAWLAGGGVRSAQATARTQAWEGTDRQVRGAVMAVLRAAPGAVHVDSAKELERFPAEQREVCVQGLVDDGLIFELADRSGWFALGSP